MREVGHPIRLIIDVKWSSPAAPCVLLSRASAHLGFAAKSIKMDELLGNKGAFPPPHPPAADSNTIITSEAVREIKSVYVKAYAPFLDSFMETTWYSEAGIHRLLQNQLLCEQLNMLLRFYAECDPTDPAIHGHETRLIWELFQLCYAAPGVDVKDLSKSVASADEPKGDLDALHVARRLSVFEQLICGQRAEANPLDVPGGALDDAFWRALGHFVTLPAHDGDHTQLSEAILSSMRQTLNVQENRDVIYSVAVMRHFKNRQVPETYAPHNDEEDPRNRLRVARHFVENEANGKASNEVVIRLCALILKCQAAQTGKLNASA
jgi:hypothetical protein